MLKEKYFLTAALVPLLLLAGCAPVTPLAPQQYSADSAVQSNMVGPPFSYRLVHNFGKGDDGVMPLAGLVNVNGKLYGTTEYGGRNGDGTVFSVGSGGGEKVLHDFGRRHDGAQPVAGLVNVNGMLYGTTELGGTYNQGTVFEVSTSGEEAVIHSFGAGDDGANPLGSLVAITHGTSVELYGTTFAGGGLPGRSGTVFKLSALAPPGEKVIHTFGEGSDGAGPQAGLVSVKGVLYGATSAGGGPSGDGTIFKISRSGAETVMIAFDCTDGMDPVARLSAVRDTLYGTVEKGAGSGSKCTSGYGSVFSVGFGDRLRTVYDFGASPDGEYPMASLTMSRGKFYSTTYGGGSNGDGTIFSIAPAGRELVLHSFGTAPDGAMPTAAPIQVGFTFYGTTSMGGKYGGGTVYAFTR